MQWFLSVGSNYLSLAEIRFVHLENDIIPFLLSRGED
jgi:hypothetical protein